MGKHEKKIKKFKLKGHTSSNHKTIKNKKIIFISVAIVLIVAITVCVYGYYTHQKSLENTIALGYNSIIINEEYEPLLQMEKGKEFKKIPRITNTGNVDCYVRVKSEVSDSRVKKDLSIDYNEDDFEYNEDDGYWYYKYILHPNESTNPLFTTVGIDTNADDLVLEGFDIYVYAESIQTIQNDDGTERVMNEVWNMP